MLGLMEIPVENQKEFVIFYSWQSDLPADTNLNAIRSALRKASNLLANDKDIKITVDEATRGQSGSPNIPATILQKISVCDMFVCDLTTINSLSGEEYRKIPNPNVLFELGYAVSFLGWERVIMLFNKHFGKFPDDLPFDVDRQRTSPYLLSVEDSKNKSNISGLEQLLKLAISAVLSNNPKKPAELIQRSQEEIKRIRDIGNLTWILSTIHIPIVDKMIIDLPHSFDNEVFHFWETFNGVKESSLFHLYDSQATYLINDVYKGWGGCLAHSAQYHSTHNTNSSVFSNRGDAPLTIRQQKAWDYVDESRALLRDSLDKLLAHIRKEYIEIDINELSRNAFKEYGDYMKE